MSFCIYEPILAFDSSTVKEISIFFQKILKIIDIREWNRFQESGRFSAGSWFR